VYYSEYSAVKVKLSISDGKKIKFENNKIMPYFSSNIFNSIIPE
jgi:hypothetical protein